MTLRQKAAWFLEYYGFVSICILVALLVIVYLGVSMLGMTSGPCDLRVMILDDRIDYAKCDEIRDYLSGQLDCSVEVLGYHSVVQEEMQAFSVKSIGNEIDIVIAPENEMLQLKANQFFENEYKAISEDGFYEECLYEEEALDNNNEYIGVCVRGPNRENARNAVDLLQKERMK